MSFDTRGITPANQSVNAVKVQRYFNVYVLVLHKAALRVF